MIHTIDNIYHIIIYIIIIYHIRSIMAFTDTYYWDKAEPPRALRCWQKPSALPGRKPVKQWGFEQFSARKLVIQSGKTTKMEL